MKKALRYISAAAACIVMTGCASEQGEGLINFFRNDYFEHTTAAPTTTTQTTPSTTTQTATTAGNTGEPEENIPKLDPVDSDGTVTICSFNNDIETFLDGWSPQGADVVFTTVDISEYYDYLDNVAFSGGSDIDIFVVDQDHLPKYLDPDFALPLEALSRIDTSEMYDFNVSDCTYGNHGLYALNLNNNPGVFLYNREVAREVLGDDSPEYVQSCISDWDKFLETAQEMNARGFKTTPNFTDMYRAFGGAAKRFDASDSVEVPPEAMEWVSLAKELYEQGMCGNGDIWTTDWYYCFTTGDFFGTFASSWLAEITLEYMKYNDSWAVCAGPNAFTWDNNYVLISRRSNSMTASMDILKRLCVDGELNYDLGMIIPDNSSKFLDESADERIGTLSGQAPCRLYDRLLSSITTSIGEIGRAHV